MCSLAHADVLSGRVVSVIDGDTIEVFLNNRPERIRLNGIDCPEKGQAYGTKAKQATSALVFGKEVTLERHGRDKFGRTIAAYPCPMGLSSISNWSETAGVGGISNTHQTM